MRLSLLFAIVAGSSVAAFGQLVDPVGFCETPTTTNCQTATGTGSETIYVGTTTFYMEKNGNSDPSSDPWYLLIAVPEANAGDVTSVPTLTSADFNKGAATSGTFEGTLSQSPTNTTIYDVAGGLTGDSSLNASNLFCDGATIPCTTSNEISAYGSLPGAFAVFEYAFTPAFTGGFVPYLFTASGSGLTDGTFLAGAGGSNPFSTPFTTAGLVNGPGGNGSGNGGPVPEPASVVLLGTISLFVASRAKKVLNRR